MPPNMCAFSRRDMATVVEHKLKAYRSDKEKFGFEPELDGGGDGRAHAGSDSTWYKEVIELRKKAGEYKVSLWRGLFRRKLGSIEN